MQVKMLTRAAGAINAAPGQVVEVTREQADELIAGRYAEAVEVQSQPPAPGSGPSTLDTRPSKGRRGGK